MRSLAVVLLLMGSCKLPAGESVRSKRKNDSRVTSAEVRELLADSGWSRDDELNRQLGGFPAARVFRHSDGRALYVIGSEDSWEGAVYDSVDELETLHKSVADAEEQHILANRQPYGEKFPEVVDKLVAGLPAILGSSLRLDYSVKSLSNLDEILQLLSEQERIESALFVAVLAYTGEVLRRASGGRWVMEQEEGIWMPSIVTNKGRQIAISVYVFDQLADPEETGVCLRCIVAAFRE